MIKVNHFLQSASIYALIPFTLPTATGNLTDLMGFASTPLPKQNVLLDLTDFTKGFCHLMWQRKYQTIVFRQQPESNTTKPGLDIFIFESFNNILIVYPH